MLSGLMWASRMGVASAAEGADVEEATLGHATPGIIEIVAYGFTTVMHDGSASFVYPVSDGEGAGGN